MSAPSSPTNKAMAVVGDRVSVGHTALCGTVRFLGTTDFATGEWMGVELDDPVGKNDGTVKGKVYFQCKELHGLFVRPSAVVKEEVVKPRMSETSAAKAASAAAAAPAPKVEVKRHPSVTTADQQAEVRRQSSSNPTSPTAEVRRPSSNFTSPTSSVFSSSPTSASFDKKPENLASVQLELAQAMEDHDLEKIKRILPLATNLGVAEGELEAAKRILSFEWSTLLQGEIDSMRGSVAMLTQSVVETETRTGIAATATKASGNAAAWLQRMGGELERRIWKKLEKRIDTIVESAVAKASVELLAASAEVQELTTFLKSSGMSLAQMKKHNSEQNKAATRFSVMNILSNISGKEAERQQRPSLVRSSVSMIMSGAIARVNNESSQADQDTQKVAEKALADAAEIRDSMKRIQRAKTQAKLKLDESAAKVQALARGRITRKDQEKKRMAVGVLQRGMRRWREFRRANPGSDIATIAMIIRQRHQDWAAEYDLAAGELGRLQADAFVAALRNIYPTKVSQKQAAALWQGYEEMSREGGPMDLQTFCAITEAVAQGEQVAAEFADIPVEDYAALADGGASGSDASATNKFVEQRPEDGSLEKAVNEAGQDGSLGKAVAKVEQDEGEVKSRAKNALLNGLKDGSLDQAIDEIVEDRSDVISKAQSALLTGLKDGSLDRAVDETLRVQQSAVRAKAKSVLLAGLKDGSLDKAIEEVQGGASEVEEVKNRTKKALMTGLQDGTLDTAITDILEGDDGSLQKAVSSREAETQKPANDAQKVRQKARGMLLSGLKDGSLEKAVSSMEEEPKQQNTTQKASQEPDQSAVKQKARGLLLSGLKDGSLEKVVNSMEAEGADSRQQKAASTLQRSVRRLMLNKTAEEKDFFGAAMIMKQKYKAYYDIFQSWLNKQEKSLVDSRRLGEAAFCGAVREAHLQTSARQAKALFEGICEGTNSTSVDLKIYCQVSQAVRAGSDLAADFCDMPEEEYLRLADPAS